MLYFWAQSERAASSQQNEVTAFKKKKNPFFSGKNGHHLEDKVVVWGAGNVRN